MGLEGIEAAGTFSTKRQKKAACSAGAGFWSFGVLEAEQPPGLEDSKEAQNSDCGFMWFWG